MAESELRTHYPLPAYNYRVTLGSLTLGVAAISGLSLEYEPVTYKHGLSFALGSQLIPGMRQPVRLTMKRGIVKRRETFYHWLRATYADPVTIARQDMLIDLCDETGAPIVRWKVQGALPIKIDAPTFDAMSNEIAIETIEIIARDLQVEYDPG